MSKIKPKDREDLIQKNFNSWLEVVSFLLGTRAGRIGSVISIFVLGGVAAVVTSIVRPDRVEIITGVGSIILKNGNTQNSVFLLSPSGSDDNNRPWVKTGIKVKKGDKIKITATGRVHTALKRLVAEAQSHETVDVTYLPWVGPEGLPFAKESKLQSAFNSYNLHKVLPSQNEAHNGYGKLLAAVENPRQEILRESIEPIGASREFQTKEDGELVLTVNDIWLKEDMKNIYVLPFDKNFEDYKKEAYFQAMIIGEDVGSWSKKIEREKAKKEYQKRQQSWDRIVKNRA